MRGNNSESVRLTTDTTEFPRLIQVYRSLLAAVVLAPCLASAQAWLPDKGEFNTSLVYNDVYNKQHYLPNGDLTYAGGAHVRSKTIAFLASYGITDKLMVQATLPYVETKYWGPPSHGGAPGFNADDGGTHGFLTDLRVTLHYQLLEEPFALAPFIGYVLPTNNNYFVKGHAAQGRGLDELLVGFGAGKNLDEWIPRTYTQMKYTYAFVEKVADTKHDRSNLSLEVGTFLTPRFNVAMYGWWQWAHGGIDVPIPQTDPLFPYHDRLAADEYFNLGLGAGYALKPTMTVFATYTKGIAGENGHRVNQGVTLGFSYGFRPRAEALGLTKQ